MLAATLTVQLNFEGRLAVLIGGGAVALRRARTLLAAGLRLKVVAPQLHPELGRLCSEYRLGDFEAADLSGAALVVACTNNPSVNDEVARLATARGLLVNHAGAAERGNLRFPALLERGDITLSISSGAQLPMLAQALREKLSAALPAQLPVAHWQTQRDAALHLSGPAREAALQELRGDIRQAVGV